MRGVVFLAFVGFAACHPARTAAPPNSTPVNVEDRLPRPLVLAAIEVVVDGHRLALERSGGGTAFRGFAPDAGEHEVLVRARVAYPAASTRRFCAAVRTVRAAFATAGASEIDVTVGSPGDLSRFGERTDVAIGVEGAAEPPRIVADDLARVDDPDCRGGIPVRPDLDRNDDPRRCASRPPAFANDREREIGSDCP